MHGGNVTQGDQQQSSDKLMTVYNEIYLNKLFLSPVTQQLLVSSATLLETRGHSYVTAGPRVELLIFKYKN